MGMTSPDCRERPANFRRKKAHLSGLIYPSGDQSARKVPQGTNPVARKDQCRTEPTLIGSEYTSLRSRYGSACHSSKTVHSLPHSNVFFG
nr:MAG TPA: hypothetical protein [Caudoviricetes sp.]